MPARPSRDAAVTASGGTCPSCGRTLLAGDHFCAGCGASVPPPTPKPVEVERAADAPTLRPPKPEILGLWHEPETKRARWLVWVGVLTLVAAGAYVALRETPNQAFPLSEMPDVPADTAPPTPSSGATGATGTVGASPTDQKLAQLEVLPSGARIAPGATVGMKAIATGSNGKVVTGRAIEWRSDAPNVAAVSRSGVVTGVAPGGAIVTATSDGRSASAMITVLWRGGGAVSLEAQPASVNIAVHQTARLNAVVRDASGNVLVPRGVEWSSSAPGTAAVSPTGMVTGLAPGTARIVVMSDGLTGAPVTVTVKSPAPVAPAPVPPKIAAPVARARATVKSAGPVEPGVVQMLVTPWAFVSVDGRAGQKRARGVDTLSARVPHRLHFERPGFVNFDTIVTLQPGEQRVLEIQMTPRKP